MRNIDNYSELYSAESFESIKVKYRRKMIFEQFSKYNPCKILEIGCGLEPLFFFDQDSRHEYTIVEPSNQFCENAVKLLSKTTNRKIRILNGFFEQQSIQNQLDKDYDMIIISALLHEIEKPLILLDAAKQHCSSHTILHINVPNAYSMHRMLGVAMGVIEENHDMSNLNILAQQNTVFDRESLNKIVTDSGFKIIDDGSIFVKPFSHAQMLQMYKSNIIDDSVLDGLNTLGQMMPEYASEIYVNCQAVL